MRQPVLFFGVFLGRLFAHAHAGGAALPRTGGWMQWTAPYWAASAGNWTALIADLHMRRYGVTREQMAWIPIVQRRNAGLNPKAIYREPLTHDAYMASRMITTPLCMRKLSAIWAAVRPCAAPILVNTGFVNKPFRPSASGPQDSI